MLLKIIPREENTTAQNSLKKKKKVNDIIAYEKNQPKKQKPVPVPPWPAHILTHEAKTELGEGSKLTSHSTCAQTRREKDTHKRQAPDAAHSVRSGKQCPLRLPTPGQQAENSPLQTCDSSTDCLPSQCGFRDTKDLFRYHCC